MIFNFWFDNGSFVLLRDLIVISGFLLIPSILYYGICRRKYKGDDGWLRTTVFWMINFFYILMIYFAIHANYELNKLNNNIKDMKDSSQNGLSNESEVSYMGMMGFRDLLINSQEAYKSFNEVNYPKSFNSYCSELFGVRNKFFFFKLKMSFMHKLQHFNFNETPGVYTEYAENINSPLLKKIGSLMSVCTRLSQFSRRFVNETNQDQSKEYSDSIAKTLKDFDNDNAKFTHTFESLSLKIELKNKYTIILFVALICVVLGLMVINKVFNRIKKRNWKKFGIISLYVISTLLVYFNIVCLFFGLGVLSSTKQATDKVYQGNVIIKKDYQQKSTIVPKLKELQQFMKEMDGFNIEDKKTQVDALFNDYLTFKKVEFESIRQLQKEVNDSVKCQNMTVQFSQERCKNFDLKCFIIRNNDRNTFYNSLTSCVEDKITLTWKYFNLHFYMDNEAKGIKRLKKQTESLFDSFEQVNIKLKQDVYKQMNKKIDVFYDLVSNIDSLHHSITTDNNDQFITHEVNKLGRLLSGSLFSCLEIGFFISFILFFLKLVHICL